MWNKQLIYGSVITAGIILVWLVFGQNDPSISRWPTRDLGLEDEAPALSELPFHQAFIDEETCLKCHKLGREMEVMGQSFSASKMLHEFRTDCTECHAIPGT